MNFIEKCEFVAKLIRSRNMGGYEHGITWHLHFKETCVDFEHISSKLEEGILSEEEPFYWKVDISGDFK